MKSVTQLGIVTVPGEKEAVCITLEDGQKIFSLIEEDSPDALAHALFQLAKATREAIAKGAINYPLIDGKRQIKKGMNFWVNNKGMDFFGDADNPEFYGMDMRHVRVVRIENQDTIICRPAHGPNQTEDFIFDADQLIKMDGKFSA